MSEDSATIRDYNDTDYSQFWEGLGKFLLHNREKRIVEALNPRNPGWFIDLGGGYGRLIPAYYTSGQNFVIVDYALNLLEEAVKRYPQENIYFIAADVYQLPFRDCVFNGGLAVRLFHHINAPRAFLRETNRILQEEASFVMSYSNKRNWFRVLKNGRKAFDLDHVEYWKMLYGTHPAYFQQLCQESQFRVDSTRGTGFADQSMRGVPALERILLKHSFLTKPLGILEDIAEMTLGNLGLLPIHFSLLHKQRGESGSEVNDHHAPNLDDILACPSCKSANLAKESNAYRCGDCGDSYPILNRIIDFRSSSMHGK